MVIVQTLVELRYYAILINGVQYVGLVAQLAVRVFLVRVVSTSQHLLIQLYALP